MVVRFVTIVTLVTKLINVSVVTMVTDATIVHLGTTCQCSCVYCGYCYDHCYIGYQDYHFF